MRRFMGLLLILGSGCLVVPTGRSEDDDDSSSIHTDDDTFVDDDSDVDDDSKPKDDDTTVTDDDDTTPTGDDDSAPVDDDATQDDDTTPVEDDDTVVEPDDDTTSVSDDDTTSDDDVTDDDDTTSVDGDGDGYADEIDCDDFEASVHPDAEEVCDDLDNDCDGTIDAGATDASTWYTDADTDGWGDSMSPVVACDAPEGTVSDATDCDDAQAEVNPGVSEICNGRDDDCDSEIDDQDDSTDPASMSVFSLDADGDGFGSGFGLLACDAPAGYVGVNTDCDDAMASTFPGAPEVCDGADNDCDGVIDPESSLDASTWYTDADGDGFGAGIGVVACYAPAGYAGVDTDCDDSNPLVSPEGNEVYFDINVPGSGIINCRDGADNDCDGAADESDTQCQDVDADGIADGLDYLFVCDLNADGLNEAVCLRADMVWSSPWSGVDCIQQISSFTELNLDDTNELEEVTWGGETFKVCPIYPTTPGNQDARVVSSYGVDGVSAVDTSDCADWVPANLVVYCEDIPDNLCTTVGTSDGCETVGRAVSFTYDGQVTP